MSPDAFKGTLSAAEAAAAISSGWRSARPDDTVDELPMSDGGPGFLESIEAASGGSLSRCTVRDPVGREVGGRVLTQAGTAYVESADACGLELLAISERHPMELSTAGVGDLLRAAATKGAGRVVVGLGGSATNDGGAGLLECLGVELRDSRDMPVGWGAKSLASLDHVIDRRRELEELPELVAATDVDNALLGPEGATAVYGRQKGADASERRMLERLVEKLAAVLGRDVEGTVGLERRAGAGAAGGLGYGLFVLGASHEPGFELVAGIVGLDERIGGADLVLTGEGHLDSQSKRGKVVAGVAAAAHRGAKPCVALAGRVSLSRREIAGMHLAGAYATATEARSVTAAASRPAHHLARLSEQIARDFRL